MEDINYSTIYFSIRLHLPTAYLLILHRRSDISVLQMMGLVDRGFYQMKLDCDFC